MTTSDKPAMKAREFFCQLDPETNEITMSHRHGCTDGFEDLHLIEYSAYESALKEIESLKAKLEQQQIEMAILTHKMSDRVVILNDKIESAADKTQSAMSLIDPEDETLDFELLKDRCVLARVALTDALVLLGQNK